MVLPQNGLEQGKLEVAGQLTHYARYVDWMVTTPLLLLALSWTAMHCFAMDTPQPASSHCNESALATPSNIRPVVSLTETWQREQVSPTGVYRLLPPGDS